MRKVTIVALGSVLVGMAANCGKSASGGVGGGNVVASCLSVCENVVNKCALPGEENVVQNNCLGACEGLQSQECQSLVQCIGTANAVDCVSEDGQIGETFESPECDPQYTMCHSGSGSGTGAGPGADGGDTNVGITCSMTTDAGVVECESYSGLTLSQAEATGDACEHASGQVVLSCVMDSFTVGTCVVTMGTMVTRTTYYSFGGFTAAEAQMTCKSSGGVWTAAACMMCSAGLQLGGNICPGAASTAYTALQTCAGCPSASDPCGKACAASLCIGSALDGNCLSCLQQPAPNGCGSEYTLCTAN